MAHAHIEVKYECIQRNCLHHRVQINKIGHGGDRRENPAHCKERVSKKERKEHGDGIVLKRPSNPPAKLRCWLSLDTPASRWHKER